MKKILAGVLAILMLLSMSVTAFAATEDFVPSIEVKPGPGVVEQETSDGRPGYGIIIMPDGTEIPIPEGEIIITPIGGADKADEDIRDALKDAYDKIKNADSLEDLVDGLQDILDQIANGADADDSVITDIFHVFIPEKYEEYFDKGGKLSLKLNGASGLIAALEKLGDKWSVLFGDSFVDNGDGTYTLIIDGSGIFAFFRDAAKVDVDYNDPEQSSPQTGDKTMIVMIAAAGLVACAFGAFAIAKKQKA